MLKMKDLMKFEESKHISKCMAEFICEAHHSNPCRLFVVDPCNYVVVDTYTHQMEEEPSRHCVQIEGLKAAWTVENRNVAFTLYDGYGKASMLKKNLSSDALKGFKVDTTHTPQVWY